MRNKRKVLMFATILLTCIVVISGMIYAGVGDLIVEYFFNSNDIKYAEELMDNNGQSYKIDDYTFKLKQTLYDNKTKRGYLVFEIKKDNGKPEIELNKKGQNLSGKGIADRFDIELSITGSFTKNYKYKKDVLYAYIEFEADKHFDNVVELVDYSKEDKESQYGFKVYEYKIKDTQKAKEYVIDQTIDMTISPLGLIIDTETLLDKVKIVVCYKNGKKETLVDTQKSKIGMDELGCLSVSGSEVEDENYIRYDMRFDELIDTDSIQYIEFNDIRIEEKN